MKSIAKLNGFLASLAFFGLAAAGLPAKQNQPPLGPGRRYTTIERLQLEHLRAVRRDRLQYSKGRREVKVQTGYRDYRAVLHAHAQDSTHTGGTRPELLAAAKRADVEIVMLTDHVRPERDFILDSWRGIHDGVLFIPGAEHEGFLAYPMKSIRGEARKPRDEYIDLIRGSGGNIFLSHVEERADWPTDKLDGLEVYNHHSDIKDEGAFMLWLQGAMTDSDRLSRLVNMLNEYPEEVFGAQQDYLSDIIAKWDRDTQRHRLTGIAANDCHHNQVFTVTVVDEQTIEIGLITSKPTTKLVDANTVPGVGALVKGKKKGELIARLDFDPYERSLRYVATHILASSLTEEAVRDALRKGHAYVAHDWLCDSKGFAFVAFANGVRQGIMGDEVAFIGKLALTVETPSKCIVKMFRNGEVVQTARADRLDFQVTRSGVYRVEAWLELDGEQRPWIYSNPIYVKD